MVRLREIINLARGFRFLRVFVAVIQREFKRHRRLSGNFILLKASLFNKGLPFRTSGWVGGWADGWMDGWMDEWMDRIG